MLHDVLPEFILASFASILEISYAQTLVKSQHIAAQFIQHIRNSCHTKFYIQPEKKCRGPKCEQTKLHLSICYCCCCCCWLIMKMSTAIPHLHIVAIEFGTSFYSKANIRAPREWTYRENKNIVTYSLNTHRVPLHSGKSRSLQINCQMLKWNFSGQCFSIFQLHSIEITFLCVCVCFLHSTSM